MNDDFKMIIILGAARSGTTMLSRLLKNAENVVYIAEPKYIWKYKNFILGHDMLTANHLTDEIKRTIRKRFKEYLELNGGEILLEKTPSNALRFEFVYNIFPNAKFIHLIRDGRRVAISARERWMGKQSNTEKKYIHPKSSISGVTRRKIKQKWERQEIRYLDVLYNLNNIIHLYLNNMGVLKHSIWGPLFPGIKEAYKKMELIEVCALQWKYCVESVLNFSKSEQFKGDYFEIRYEDIVQGDKSKVQEMFQFAGLEYNEHAKHWASAINKSYNPSKLEINESDLHLINKHCRVLLDYLGYE